ncbi:MAG: metallophosphoesterase family protein [Bacilli bacterium]|nr:metallophosphoesterase family protein [Bacilli bacterium]
MNRKLNHLFSEADHLAIDEKTKIVIMSDCHRGSGDNYDNFVKNKNIYEAALRRYYSLGFTYIELGDGDDMWEVKHYKDIVSQHLSTFKLLKKFWDAKRFIMIYGNHDICKNKPSIVTTNFYSYYDKATKQSKDLFVGLKPKEALVLDYKGYAIFLLHGHQVDIFNSTFWRLSRFLVRHVWRPLESIGLKDPTSAAKNYRGTKRTDKKLEKWSTKKQNAIIAGHTHRPIYPEVGHSLYFNDGTCIHPDGITCIEIENGKITLVKWSFQLKNDTIISVGREILEGPESLLHFWK